MSLWLQSSLRRATGPQGFTLPVLLPRRCLSSKVPPGMANAGSHQSPIVDELWRRRNPGCGRTQDLLPGAPRPLVRRPPSHSLTEIRYEFEDPGNAALVDKYTNPWGQLRVGRLLEDLDALAGTVAFKHCLPEDSCWAPQHLVTAAVDRIRCVHRPNLKDDILLTGQVIWVGRTSMVIQMLARASWAREPFVDARFTFVARDPQTGKASQINPLEVRSPEEQALFDSGEALNEERKRSRALARNSLMGQPIDAEGHIAANALLEEASHLLTMPTLANKSDILLSDTRLHNALITQPQQRNTAGRIFGGFLMRRAYELAFATAYLFAGQRPVFTEIDEVSFLQPVSIGDLLRFDSCVLYTSQDVDPKGRTTIHVEVVADVVKPEARTSERSNTFNFTFRLLAPDGQDVVPVHRVLPATLTDALKIITRQECDRLQSMA